MKGQKTMLTYTVSSYIDWFKVIGTEATDYRKKNPPKTLYFRGNDIPGALRRRFD